MAHALTGIEAERESRQLDAVRTAAWICVIASLIFMAIEIAEHTTTLFTTALRLGIVTIFLATAMATRRGWLRPSLVATLLTACAFLYCVLVIGRGTPEDDDLLPVVVAITPVVIPLRLRIAFPLLALAAVGFCVATVSRTAAPDTKSEASFVVNVAGSLHSEVRLIWPPLLLLRTTARTRAL